VSELSKRILTASILAPLAIWWLLFSVPPWFELLLGLLAVAALFELVVMLQLPLRRALVFSGSAAFALVLLSGQVASAIMLIGVVWMAILALSARSMEADAVRRQVLHMGLAYWFQVWLLLFVWVLMHVNQQPHGAVFVFAAFVGVWAADIGAYFFGRAFGKHKLCAAISPGKSVEGALAGSICGMAAACSIWVIYAEIPLVEALVIGLALVVTAILGDLAESAIKRAVGVKDSGRMLPGHGGLLDRIDALLPAVAVAGILKMGIGLNLGLGAVL